MDRSKRENAVIGYKDKINDVTYCNGCKDYYGDIHGTCPMPHHTRKCGSGIIDENYIQFDNTIHISLLIYGQPCRAEGYGCKNDCDNCVILLREWILPPIH